MSVNDLVGVPYKRGGDTFAGADCWGLVLLALEHVFGLRVDECRGCTVQGDDLSDTIDATFSSATWRQVAAPEDGDVVVMFSRATGRPEHVGIVVSGRVLHSMSARPGCASAIHELRSVAKLFKRLEFFRHESR